MSAVERYAMQAQTEDRFLFALKNQINAIGSLILLEAHLRFGRRSLGFYEDLASIAIHVAGFTLLRYISGMGSHYGMAAIPFMTVGIFVFWMLRTNLNLASAFKSAKGRYRFNARVTQLDVLIARTVISTILYLGIGFATFYIFVYVGIGPMLASPWMVAVILLISGVWGFGCGLILGGAFLYFPVLRTIWGGMMRVLMYTSGLMFIWAEVPYSFRFVVEYNPLFHMAELVRQFYFGTYVSPVASWRFIFFTVVVTLALGLAIERICREKALNAPNRNESADEELF